MPTLSLEEQETHLNMVADDRNTWDDPVMQRRLEAAGAVFVKASGPGKHYTLTSDQVVLRSGKRKVAPLTEAQKETLAKGRAKRLGT